MEDKKLYEKEIGAEGQMDIKLEDGMVRIEGGYKGKGGGGGLFVYVDPAYLVDKITDLIPGETDDALLDEWAKRLLSKKTN